MINTKNPILYVVVPCYNEEEGLVISSEKLLNHLLKLEKEKIVSKKSKILFVNDGSKDSTEQILNDLVDSNKKYSMLSFSANAGHQNAVYAGMMASKDCADIVITIDADLQQDINAMADFINAYKNGADVVYGVRNDRSSDGVFKKTTASLYYSFMKFLGSNLLPNSADYRLLSKKALICLSEYKEANLFLRGLIPTMGLKSDTVYFDVRDREFGQSKYTLKKMFDLAISGITSFSVMPIHLICFVGFLLAGVGFVLLFLLLITGSLNSISGLYVLFTMLFGVTIACIGIVGEYTGAASMQVKNRPRYIIDYVRIEDSKNEKNGK